MKAACMIVGCLTLIAVLAVAMISDSTPESAPSPPPRSAGGEKTVKRVEARVFRGEGERTDQEMLELTDSMMPHYDEIGKYWMKVLDDEEGQTMQRVITPDKHRLFAVNQRRVYAAKVLGQMQYLPAIPVLIKHIRLDDRTVTLISDSGDGFASQEALVEYGDAAVPQIVDAYLNDTGRSLSLHFVSAMSSGRPREVASAYFLGLYAKHDKRITDKDFGYFR